MILKILLVVVVGLLALGGRRRIAELLGAAKESPRSFRDGKGRAEDPAAYAKEVGRQSADGDKG
jgi:Sec-independent protein translocase protein TatA